MLPIHSYCTQCAPPFTYNQMALAFWSRACNIFLLTIQFLVLDQHLHKGGVNGRKCVYLGMHHTPGTRWVLSVHEQPKGDSSQFPLLSGPHKYYLDGSRAEIESGEVGLVQDVIVSLA